MAIFDTPTGSGEYMGNIDGALAAQYSERITTAESLLSDEHQLKVRLKVGEDTLQLPADSIEFEAAEEPGNFLVRFKHEVQEHPKRTALVTGAALILCYASFHPVSRVKKSKK